MDLPILSLILLLIILFCMALMIKAYKALELAKKEFTQMTSKDANKLTQELHLDLTESLEKLQKDLDKKISGMVEDNLSQVTNKLEDLSSHILSKFEKELGDSCELAGKQIVDEIKMKYAKADDQIAETAKEKVEQIYLKYFKTAMSQKDQEKLTLTILETLKPKLKA